MNKSYGDEIDFGLYSRQLYALGYDTMKKMSATSVLISGIGSLGVEVAKNVILSGIKYVTIHDTVKTHMNDLSSQYYLTKDDIGKNRADACYKKLTELNKNVSMKIHTQKLTNDFIKNFDIVVLTDLSSEEQIRINNYTHEHNIKFISGCTLGLFGQIFCDFNNFTVNDVDGEKPNTAICPSYLQY